LLLFLGFIPLKQKQSFHLPNLFDVRRIAFVSLLFSIVHNNPYKLLQYLL